MWQRKSWRTRRGLRHTQMRENRARESAKAARRTLKTTSSKRQRSKKPKAREHVSQAQCEHGTQMRRVSRARLYNPIRTAWQWDQPGRSMPYTLEKDVKNLFEGQSHRNAPTETYARAQLTASGILNASHPKRRHSTHANSSAERQGGARKRRGDNDANTTQ